MQNPALDFLDWYVRTCFPVSTLTVKSVVSKSYANDRTTKLIQATVETASGTTGVHHPLVDDQILQVVRLQI